MTISERISPRLNEKYIHIVFDNGLNCYIVPKKTSSYSACFAVNFGSVDRILQAFESKSISFPSGTAHFLEHKMFETKDGDAFEKYAVFGGDANAYTAGDRTCYFFTCTEMFEENLRILLDHVLHAEFSTASIKKERDIIIQEINMYNDNPRWKCRRNMMKCLYGECAISADPAGSAESISKITREQLNLCRESIYILSNMVLCISGDVDVDSITSVIAQSTKNIPFREKPLILTPQISEKVNANSAEAEMDVSIPLFSVGIRLPLSSQEDSHKDFTAVELIVSMLFGKSNDFYCDCYNKGLFEELSDSYQTIRNTFYIDISGASKKPYDFYEAVLNHIEATKINGFSRSDFERAKKALYAEMICSYESPEEITDSFVSCFIDDYDLFDSPDVLASIDLDYVNQYFNRMFFKENICISVIKPKGEILNGYNT